MIYTYAYTHTQQNRTSRFLLTKMTVMVNTLYPTNMGLSEKLFSSMIHILIIRKTTRNKISLFSYHFLANVVRLLMLLLSLFLDELTFIRTQTSNSIGMGKERERIIMRITTRNFFSLSDIPFSI